METGVLDFDLFIQSETRTISKTVLIAADVFNSAANMQDGISYPYFSKIYSLIGSYRGVGFIILKSWIEIVNLNQT